MSFPIRTVYLNGQFLPEHAAHLSVFDRGFLFGDGVYEVTAVLDGKLIDSPLHMARLERNANELSIRLPVPTSEIVAVEKRLVAENSLEEGLIYLQLTRGVEDRNFLFSADLSPTLLMFTQSKKLEQVAAVELGLRVKIVPDQRWVRRDIKSICLLPQVLAKRSASADGFDEAWMEEDGFITEGASSTAYIVSDDGAIITRGASRETLPGCTKQAITQLVKETGLSWKERRFSVEEVGVCREAWLSSASNFIVPITNIDGKPIRDGKPGPIFRRIRALYMQHARATSI